VFVSGMRFGVSMRDCVSAFVFGMRFGVSMRDCVSNKTKGAGETYQKRRSHSLPPLEAYCTGIHAPTGTHRHAQARTRTHAHTHTRTHTQESFHKNQLVDTRIQL
jgi:hypothetical protein